MLKNKNKIITIIITVVTLILLGLFIFPQKKDKFDLENKEVTSDEIQSDNKSSNENIGVLNENKIIGNGSINNEEVNKLYVQSVEQQLGKNFTGAKLSLEKALKLEPNNIYIMQSYAELLNIIGDKTGALIWINKAISLKPNEINFWYSKFSIVNNKSGNSFGIKEAVYLDAIKLTKNNTNMITAYASFLGNEGKKEESIKQWQKAIELVPEKKVIYQAEIDRLNK